MFMMKDVYPEISYLYPVFAYLLGSIPFGLILSNLFGKKNLRESGSKNIGATNVMRTQGKTLGVLTFLLDFLKGLLGYHIFQADNEIINLIVMAMPILGHMFPVWLKFKGGKGIASYFGLLCAINVYVFIITALLWIGFFSMFRISSVAGLISVVMSCCVFGYVRYICNQEFINMLCVLIALSVLIIVKHTGNIKRLFDKKELRV
jgi:glycerol-3-phosphate acyltransferase PlsY